MNLSKSDVLVLNAVWLPIGITNYKKAIVCLNSDNHGGLVAKALDIQYKQIDDNTYDFDSPPISITPVSFEEWMELPIRSYDATITTPRRVIRLPSIIVTLQFAKMPMRKVRPTHKNIMERDNYTCQYTGKQLPKSKLNIDHYIPKSKGGKDTFTNLITCSKELNSKKGSKSAAELGLSLIRKPFEPHSMPASALIREIRHRDWLIFLNK